MKNLIVFDWNGTLFDDTEATLHCTNEEFALMGADPITLERMQDTFSFPLVHFYERNGIDVADYLARAENAGRHFLTCHAKAALKCGLGKGAADLLAWGKANHITMMVLSNHFEARLKEEMTRFGIEHYFKAVSANVDMATVTHKMNKEERLRFLLEEYGFAPEHAVIIGDSHEEPEIARRVGLTSISITGGVLSKERLYACEPDYVIETLEEVPEILQNRWALAA
ncbi:MAG: HAD family hydrolase [Pseudobdellovibrionaceae bacterium]